MIAQQAANSAVEAVVSDYFAGERLEMVAAIIAFMVADLLAVWLFIASRTGFASALMTTVLLFGGMMAAGLASLILRDHASSRILTQALQTERYAAVIAAEKTRVSVVLSKFGYYRMGAAVLGILALAGMTLSNRDWVHGVAAGLLLVVSAQVIIDHFSERRASSYLARLINV